MFTMFCYVLLRFSLLHLCSFTFVMLQNCQMVLFVLVEFEWPKRQIFILFISYYDVYQLWLLHSVDTVYTVYQLKSSDSHSRPVYCENLMILAVYTVSVYSQGTNACHRSIRHKYKLKNFIAHNNWWIIWTFTSVLGHSNPTIYILSESRMIRLHHLCK